MHDLACLAQQVLEGLASQRHQMVRVEALHDAVVVQSLHGRGELLAELLEQGVGLAGAGCLRRELAGAFGVHTGQQAQSHACVLTEVGTIAIEEALVQDG